MLMLVLKWFKQLLQLAGAAMPCLAFFRRFLFYSSCCGESFPKIASSSNFEEIDQILM
jgi:hypothetical protein